MMKRVSCIYQQYYFEKYTDDERTELLKGKGSNVLKTATKIINELNLDDLLDTKINLLNVPCENGVKV